MTFLSKSGSLVVVWIKTLATAVRCSFFSGSRSHGTYLATACFMPKSCIKISHTVVFGIPRFASSSHTVSHQSLLITTHTHSTFSGILLVADLPERESLSTDSWLLLKLLCYTFICTALIASSPKPKTFWIIRIVSAEGHSSLMQNLMQIPCSTRSVILNAMATQYTCSLSGVDHPHWLVQWSHYCSCMSIQVHTP